LGSRQARRQIQSGLNGVDPQVTADAPARLLQALQERPDTRLIFRIVRGCGQEYADAPHPFGLLRAGAERPPAAAPPSSAMNSRRLIR